MVNELLTAIKTIDTLHKFVEDGGMFNVLKEIGDNEFEAAIDALSELQYSNNKDYVINRVISHLESSHQIFHNIRLNNTTMLRIRRAAHASKIEYWSNCIMALCHVYLKDDKSLVLKKINRARYAFNDDDIDHNKPETVRETFENSIAVPIVGLYLACYIGKMLIFGDKDEEDDGMNMEFLTAYEKTLLQYYRVE